MAALFRRCWLGSVHERRLGIRCRLWLWLGIGVPLGMDAVPLRRMDLFAQQRMGVAARRLLGRMECPKDRPPAVEFRFATAPVKYRPRNDRREPWSGAGPTREIIQPAGNLQELGGTRNSARGYQELEPTIEHSPTAGICHGKSSHRALRDQLVARWQLCTSLADGRMAWRWRLQYLSRTFQFGSFQCSLEPQRRNDDPTQLQRGPHRVAFSVGPGNSPWYSTQTESLLASTQILRFRWNKKSTLWLSLVSGI
jgi:hypothetical protein